MTGRRKAGACLALITFSGLALVACSTSAPAASTVHGNSVAKIRVGNVTRTYLINRPAAAGRRRPLIVFLHGSGSSGAAVQSELKALPMAQSAGIITVFPNGVAPNHSWRTGCCNAWADTTADVDFVAAVIHRLVNSGAVDRHRVVVGGFSAGAMLANTVACRHPRLVRAAVSVAGTLLEPPPFVHEAAAATRCRPHRPVSVYEIHGTADRTLPVDGSSSRCRATGCGPGARGWQPSVPTVNTWWRRLDRCAAAPTKRAGGIRTSLTRCAKSTHVGLALVAGVGHSLADLRSSFPVGPTLVQLAQGRQAPRW